MTCEGTPGPQEATRDRSLRSSSALRLVVLASGGGSTLQALLDAAARPGCPFTVGAVGSDSAQAGALERARASGVPTFVVRLPDFDSRAAWDEALARATAVFHPGLVVSAGFLKLLGPAFLSAFAGRCVNSHPSLLPAFPGVRGPRDALEHGVKVSGATLFVVDAGTDTGPILAQRAVPVHDGDTEVTLHERIKDAEREMLVSVVSRMATHGWTVDGRKATLG